MPQPCFGETDLPEVLGRWKRGGLSNGLLNIEFYLWRMFGHTDPIDASYLSGGLNMDIHHHHRFEHGWQLAFVDFVGQASVNMASGIFTVVGIVSRRRQRVVGGFSVFRVGNCLRFKNARLVCPNAAGIDSKLSGLGVGRLGGQGRRRCRHGLGRASRNHHRQGDEQRLTDQPKPHGLSHS